MTPDEATDLATIRRIVVDLAKFSLATILNLNLSHNALRTLLERDGVITHQAFLDRTEELRQLADPQPIIDAMESLGPTDEFVEFLKRFQGPIQ
jgi:hypothetical protein